jgi:UDP-3-O-[3-hydroxymyristoyl] glucosamine N-acyltransferase
MRHTRASAVILGEHDESAPCALLRARQPYLAFAHAVALFAPRDARPAGVHRLADVAPDVTIASDASVGAFVSIGAGAIIGSRSVLYPHATIGAGARIGEDCIIHARASIRERVVLGNRVIVQDGAVIGSDGFGFARTPDGDHQKIPQIGGVVIEDDVTLAGQVGVAGHLTLGKGVVATAQSGIPNSVPEGAFISGYPAIPNRDWLKASAIFRRLPELKKAVADLQRRLEELASRVRET